MRIMKVDPRALKENPDRMRQSKSSPQAEHEILYEQDELEGNDVPKLDALRESAREHADSFILKSDLEDADQREATPGVREQP
jgi:hypothetical protein